MSFRCNVPNNLTNEEYKIYIDKKFRFWLKYESSIDWDTFVEPSDFENNKDNLN